MKSEKTSIKRFAPLLIILAVLVAAVAIVTPVTAYYIRTAGEVSGDYTAAESEDPSFTLSETKNSVSNVTITVPDEGYPVYVRAMIVVTWKINGAIDGTVQGDVFFGDLGAPVPDDDYTLAINGTDWKQINGFWYCTSPVLHGATDRKTPIFIRSCNLRGNAKKPDENCVLSVEIIVQTVQAIGSTDGTNEIPAWEDAWGVKL